MESTASACHRLGVPFFVAQKETTISELTMTADAERVRAFASPIADHMTVCSERHRQFQLRAGAVPDRVTVTGQPASTSTPGLRNGPPGTPTRGRSCSSSPT